LEFDDKTSLGCTVVRPYLFLKLVFVAVAPGLIKGEVNPAPDNLAAVIGDFLPAILIIESLSAILSNFIGDLSVFENLGLLSDYYD
jgi:hypothetical protein